MIHSAIGQIGELTNSEADVHDSLDPLHPLRYWHALLAERRSENRWAEEVLPTYEQRTRTNVGATSYKRVQINVFITYFANFDFVITNDHDARECVGKETEFYAIGPEKRSPDLEVGDWVMWKEDAIEAYWKFFARYEHNGRNTGAETKCANSGTECIELDTRSNNINYEEWKPMKDQMQVMKGTVTKVVKRGCCNVKWDNGWNFHHLQAMLRLAPSQLK
ncbi:unnamed protein product [Cylicocyclus nassatus]|uniref:Uncharacterized protein n=1 Tax=Cylicocyclus nassatus TaxID=53992 RepID=A0AA36DQJ5_CYLNA|nr:unnamed protein product [Cylicocyclus nassatus]